MPFFGKKQQKAKSSGPAMGQSQIPAATAKVMAQPKSASLPARPPPPPAQAYPSQVAMVPAGEAVSIDQLESRIHEIRDNQLTPLRECLQNDASPDMIEFVDAYLDEARGNAAQLQSQADYCLQHDRFDVVQQIIGLGEELSELEERATNWKQRLFEPAAAGDESARRREADQQRRREEEEQRHREEAEEQRRREEADRQRRMEEEQRQRPQSPGQIDDDAWPGSAPGSIIDSEGADRRSQKKNKEKKDKKKDKKDRDRDLAAPDDQPDWLSGFGGSMSGDAGAFPSSPKDSSAFAMAPPASQAWGAPAAVADGEWPATPVSGGAAAFDAGAGFDTAAPSFEPAFPDAPAGGSSWAGAVPASSSWDLPGSQASQGPPTMPPSPFGGAAVASSHNVYGDIVSAAPQSPLQHSSPQASPAGLGDGFGWGAESKPGSSMASPGNNSPGGTRATMVISTPYSEVAGNMDEFRASFIRSVAAAAGIDPRRIRIHGVHANF